jgi:precorrin-3B C17-methyltransferase
LNRLTVVGIGPGDRENMTLAADEALKACDLIAGYTLYVDLVRPLYPDKEYYSTPMTGEAERCRAALKAASEGRDVCLVCSGDSGIYGMAGLVYELRGEAEEPEIRVIPGITSACAGAALLGAPLTHDFAVISLSDRLTPWELIEKRLVKAAEADLTIALYNPASKGRPDHLRRACDILMRVLPKERLCAVARNIGRDGESVETMSLGELAGYPADMFCTVFIGNAAARLIGGKMITPRGYRDV